MGSNVKMKKKCYEYYRRGNFSLVTHNELDTQASSRKLSRSSLNGKGRKGHSRQKRQYKAWKHATIRI